MDTSNYRPWQDAVNTLKTVMGMAYSSVNDRAMATRTLVGVNQAMWRVASERATDLICDRFNVAIQNDGTFWAPRGYGPLQAINLDGRPNRIRSRFYEFHANGQGAGRSVRPETFLIGNYATMADAGAPFKIGVAATLRESGAKVVVEGIDANGDAVTTFVRDDAGQEIAARGVMFQPSSNMVENTTVLWKEVTAVRKEESLGAMHVMLTYGGGSWERIAELGPKDELSRYSRYRLGACPAECKGWPCVTAVFKLDMPANPSPWVMVSSESALVQLAGAVRDSLKHSDGVPAMQAKKAAVSFAANAALDEILAQQPPVEHMPPLTTHNSPNLRFRPV